MHILFFIMGVVLTDFLIKSLQEYPTKDKIELEIRQTLTLLFFKAEKIYPESEAKRMPYVLHKIYDIVPGKHIDKVLNGEPLEVYVQRIYTETKQKYV